MPPHTTMRPLGLFGISCFALMIAGAWGTQFRSGLARLVTPAGPAEPRPPTSSLPAIVAQALSCSTPITLDGCRFDVRSRNPPSGSIGVKIVCDNVRANSAAQPLDLIGQALTMTLANSAGACSPVGWTASECRASGSRLTCSTSQGTSSPASIRLSQSPGSPASYRLRARITSTGATCSSNFAPWTVGFEAGSACGEITCSPDNASRSDKMTCGPRCTGTDAGNGGCPDGGVGVSPIPTLPVVEVTDLDGDGNYDQDDIDIAMDDCSPGCNLKLLPVTYRNIRLVIGNLVSQGFAMYGSGIGRTVLQSRIAPVGGYYDYAIYVTSSAPDGLVFQDFTLDGMKFQQPIPTQTADPSAANWGKSVGIIVADFYSANSTNTDGIIRRLHIKDFLQAGVLLMDAARWRIEQNRITDMGCHTIDTPCGSAWLTVPENLVPPRPNRKTDGFGILLGKDHIGTVVANNTVTGATKIGIEIFGGGDRTCDHPSTPRNIVIENNTVTRAAQGIGVNGGCNYIIRDNVVQGSIATGSEDQNLGVGFFCAAGGENGIWLRNRSSNNQLSGFSLDCPGANIDVVQNVSSNNCLTTTYNSADITLSTRGQTGIPGGDVLDNTVSDNNCFAGMRITGRTNVTVSGGSIEGGSEYGLWFSSASNVRVSNMQLNARPSRHTSGAYDSNIGILLNTGAGPLQQVNIDRSSVPIRNFEQQIVTR